MKFNITILQLPCSWSEGEAHGYGMNGQSVLFSCSLWH